MAKIQYRWQFYGKGKGGNSPWRGLNSVIILALIFYFVWAIVFAGIIWG